MKKYLLLTSLSLLTACGGAGGGLGSGIRVSSDAIESNKNVTSMASEILIAQDGASPNIVRSASVINGGKEYIAYHLDDAKFLGTDMDDGEYISFGIDSNGQINNMSYHWQDNGSEVVESVNRDGPTSSIFTEHVYKYHVKLSNNNVYYTDSLPINPNGYSKEQIKQAFRHTFEGESGWTEARFAEVDSIVDATDMQPTEYEHHNVIDLYGKKLPDSHKLRYSDFGYTTILENEVHTAGDGEGDDNSLVFGGYERMEIQNPSLTDMTFSGKAIAALGDVMANGVHKIETDDTAATLTIDNDGNQTLEMPFNDYYTISVEKPQNGNETISWTGTTNINDGGKNYALDDTSQIYGPQVNVQYYGDDAGPSEVVGGIRFQNNNVEFNGAFGLKADSSLM